MTIYHTNALRACESTGIRACEESTQAHDRSPSPLFVRPLLPSQGARGERLGRNFFQKGRGSPPLPLAPPLASAFTFDPVRRPLPGAIVTNLLYSGEQTDANLGMQYLRNRFETAGRFLSMDSYAGSISDPKSLHKYLYCTADPINYVDPTGNLELTLSGLVLMAGISASLDALGLAALGYHQTHQLDPFKDPPPFLLTLIPVLGPLAQAGYDFRHGNTFWGFVNIGFAALDVATLGISSTFTRGVEASSEFVIRNGGELATKLVSGTLEQAGEWLLREGANIERIYSDIKDLEGVFKKIGGKYDINFGRDLSRRGRPARGFYDTENFVIYINRGATLGTYLEELIHAEQIFVRYTRNGITATEEIIEAARFELEQEVKRRLTDLGFFKP